MNGKGILDTPAIQSLDRGLAILEAVAASSQPVPLKELTGLTRKHVIPLLEYLDRERVTRRAGADRVLL